MSYENKNFYYHSSNFNYATVIITSILCTLSGLLPVENLFVTFSTPEKAFHYMHCEKVALVVEGEASALVIGEKSEADYVYLAVPKCSDGWKLGQGKDIELKDQILGKDVAIHLYCYEKTGEYYITVLNMGDGVLAVSDSCHSEFLTLNKTEASNWGVYSFANIRHFDESYQIEVNSQVFSFEK